MSVADSKNCGEEMYRLLSELFPLCRSLSGEGVRQTLRILQQHIPLTIHEVPSGTKAFDWTVPNEWNIRKAYIENEAGERIVDFVDSNLHVLGYSVPVDKVLSLTELQEHLYSLEDQPTAIPYVTSYYSERWGFCLTHTQRENLPEGNYHVVIDSDLKPGHMTYGDMLIPGKTEEEILISSYVCHPSMANNELSGPVVATAIVKWLMETPRRYSYRILFVPETIGSITYLSQHLEEMKQKTIAGFLPMCIGDEGHYSYVATPYGNTLADKVALRVLSQRPDFKKYSYLESASDQRQFCSPLVGLPVVALCRTKYDEYAEYHTSLDDLDFVSPAGLLGGFSMLKECLEILEKNKRYKLTSCGMPQLGKRGLYPSVSTKEGFHVLLRLLNLIDYADGSNDLLSISELIDAPLEELYPLVDDLVSCGLFEE